ncbi:Yip1-domain-containing protein [Aspergillus sclerotioniger CBS 115572]|uniref:Yip1-domain-containing protein n=1 Tax=Aspergillus sclerotioniger CBS 115572 TaxID=1450535 RepID=A0A317VA94_9EURO|nr:Yip1-domain-containing protein [Aspergillus sclerotioniger CBS 115572]PWY69822.1 Yip1-domain-containing protein [Aspergillus sclerotioniger CBS 115572]
MSSPLSADDEDIFARLQQRADPKVLEEQQQAVDERARAIYQKAQTRLEELIDQNSTLPCAISSVQVHGAHHTRRGFLERVFNPLLSSNQDRPFTLSEALREVSARADKLNRFDIFQQPVSVYLDQSPGVDAQSGIPTLSVHVSAKEKSRVMLKTGTDLGNTEGSAYGNLLWRNVFGGAENLNLNASLGTRTRSAYQATLETPVFSDPDFCLELGGLASATQKSWAGHEEVLKGGWTKFRWASPSGQRHEFGYNGFWRQMTGLSESASPTVRADAGDNVKSSVFHSWTKDRRDSPLLPSRGYYAKAFNEVAGWGPLKGDVSFWKSEIETQAAVPIPIPGLKGDSGISLTTGFRAGLLYPLGLDSDSRPQLSRTNDRFVLGGPTDVRGFRLCGLGPHDGADAVGGDVYAAGSANLLFPLPRVGAEKPLRLQAFVNGGRLLPLRTTEKNAPTSSTEVKDAMVSTVSELANGLPSIAAGVGLVFELNFSLPLVLRKGEEGRKGLQLGIGINFLEAYYPQQPPYGVQASAQNLQFYPSSYGSVSGHTTPSQASYGAFGAASNPASQAYPAGGVGGGYGGFGSPTAGVSGRMGEQGGLRTGWLAAFGTEGYEGEPPLLEELGVNFEHIRTKTLTVLNPFARIDQHLMDDSDLYGALLYIVLYGTFLLLSGKVFYGYIYGVAVFGTVALHLILSLMSPALDTVPVPNTADPANYSPHHKPSMSDASAAGHFSATLTFPRSASVLGYCFLPLVLTSLVGILTPMDTMFGYLLTTAAVGWCTYSSSGMFCAVARMRGMRGLVAYPLALFYVVFGIMGIFSSRGSGTLAARTGAA